MFNAKVKRKKKIIKMKDFSTFSKWLKKVFIILLPKNL